jgi:PPP family 3-phenylpropionic acid transporter
MFYLFFYTAASCMWPFIILYYQESGFNGTQIGLLAGMAPLVAMLGAPLWTGLADTTGRHKLIMSLAILGALVSASVYPLFHSLAPMFLLVFLYSLFNSPIMSFADSATMGMLADKKNMYGRVRLGGTIGWGLMAPLASLIIQAYGLRWSFWGYAIIMVLVFIVSQRFTFGKKVENISFGRNMRPLLADRKWVIFLSLAFVGGVALASINAYMFPYMEQLGISRSTMGIALTISTLGELPILFFANRLLKRLGAYGLLVLGLTITGIRLLLYAWLNFTAGILIFQLLNGMTYPMIWVAGVSYAYENAPEGMKATAQGLFGAMIVGIGAAAGSFLGGLMLEGIGGRWMYLIFGVGLLVSVAVITRLGRGIHSHQVGDQS